MKELRVALIGGAGFMGKAHSLAYAHAAFLDGQDARLVREVLVDVDAAAAAAAAERLGWNRSGADWRAVLADPSIDIVDIVTPPHTHAEIAAAALEAGKHVFCEKPITNDGNEAAELAARAAASSVRKLRHTSSSNVSRMSAPNAGPNIVPRPPSRTMTSGLTASSTSKASGGSI